MAPLTYDHPLFERLRGAFLRGELDHERARMVQGPCPLDPEDPQILRPSAATRAALTAAGEAALARGEVAALILNGGLATRFGGVVKGIVPALAEAPEGSFLALKLAALRALGAPVPAIIMCSFATREASLAHLGAIAWAGIEDDHRLTFDQSVLPRIDRDGIPLFARAGADTRSPSELYAAPGHGDTLEQAASSGLVANLRDRGIRHVLVSNVDNLGATIDPLYLGLHLAAVARGAAVSVEAVRRQAGDVGGLIARIDGAPVIVEGFRLPATTDPGGYPYFNTNTLWLTLDALGSRPPLTYFPVQRSVQWAPGEVLEVIQFERLIGQITEFAATAILEVERERRFLPIKTQADLKAAQPWIAAFAADLASPGPQRR